MKEEIGRARARGSRELFPAISRPLPFFQEFLLRPVRRPQSGAFPHGRDPPLRAETPSIHLAASLSRRPFRFIAA